MERIYDWVYAALSWAGVRLSQWVTSCSADESWDDVDDPLASP